MLEMDHPNIVRIYEVYTDEKYIYFVMELLKGKNLFDAIFNDNFHSNEKKVRELFF